MAKIAVINRTNLINYGSVLQCYALCRAVRDLGYESEILWEEGNLSSNFDFRLIKVIRTGVKVMTHPSLLKSTIKSIKEIREKEIHPETVKLFRKFVEENIQQRTLMHNELVDVAHSDEYLKFICGSDQVWCSTTTYVDPLMYLRFVPREKRIAYAPSIGRDYIPKYNRKKMRKYITDIPHVSIRENDGRRLVKELTGREVPVVADPTLLLEREVWEPLKDESIQPARPYVLCYFLDTPSQKTQQDIELFAKEKGLEIISIGRELDIENIQNPFCGPSQFLSYVSNATMVITDSYHGMLFSIIYKKKFWAIERSYQQFDQSSRQLTVLDKLNLRERYISDTNHLSREEIDYDTVHEKIKDFREFSLEYLRESISN